MKILVCITFILGSFLTLYAQGEAGISGKVSDVKGQPVSYANITLQRVDSLKSATIIQYTIKGRFMSR